MAGRNRWMTMSADSDTILHILTELSTWAVVGCSTSPARASHGVARFLMAKGKTVIPIHPRQPEVLGTPAYRDLAAVPEGTEIDVVDIFRRSDKAGAHVDEAIALGAKAVWMQLGVIDEAAATRAQDAGLLVVMDRCPKIEWGRLGL